MRAAIAILVVILSGCNANRQADEITREGIEAAGKVWPFTVDRGRVGCDAGRPFFEVSGTRYALNGIARGRYPYADPILRRDEKMIKTLRAAGDTNPYEPRIDPADIRKMASGMCGG